jgi:hypothetical protein
MFFGQKFLYSGEFFKTMLDHPATRATVWPTAATGGALPSNRAEQLSATRARLQRPKIRGRQMSLKIADDGSPRRGRGRPSAVDREFERRMREAAAADLARELDSTLDDERFVPGTKRHRRGPPVLSGRSLQFVALIASGARDEDARIACKLQRRALRRLLAASPLFQAAIAGARAAAAQLAKPQCVARDAPCASSAVMTKQIDLRRNEPVTRDASVTSRVTSGDDEAAALSVKVNIINRDHPPEAK